MSASGSTDPSARAPATRTLGEGVESGGRIRVRSGIDRSTEVRPITAADVDRFVEAVRGSKESDSFDMARAMLDRGIRTESIYMDLLAPAARRMGELWVEDRCDFLDVTMAVGRLQRVMRILSQSFLDEAGTAHQVGSIILTALPGHHHSFGLFLAAEFFVRDGWGVSVGAPISNFDLHTALRADWFDVVAFSVATTDEIVRLAAEIQTARRNSRNPRVKILVGGRVFRDQPELAERVGADAAAGDARDGPAIASRLLGSGAA